MLLFVAGAVFGEVEVSLFVAGAVFGEIWNDSRSAKCCIFEHATKCEEEHGVRLSERCEKDCVDKWDRGRGFFVQAHD